MLQSHPQVLLRGLAYTVVEEKRDDPERLIRWYAAGWPCHAFGGSSEGGAIRLGPKAYLSVVHAATGGAAPGVRAPRFGKPTAEIDAVFPVVPQWSGLLLNTFLYVAAVLLLAALWVVPRGVVRRF